MPIRKIRTGIIFSLVFAVIVMTAIALYADLPHLFLALAHFRWEFLPLILGLTLFNYFWRFTKWQYYLRRLNVKIHWQKSLLIFISGLSMAITPGKVGELLKSYLLKRSTGEAISRTSPIIMAERLTDGIAMIGLAAIGLVLYRAGLELMLALLVIVLVGIFVIQNRRLSLASIGFAKRLPFVSRIANLIHAFYESAYTLLQWRPLLLAILIGLVSWLGECGALYFVFVGLGLGSGLDLFIKATFIMALSSLVGSVSGLPGGLGTADGSMLGLTLLLTKTSAALGGAATLLIRLCTLWFGLGLGVIALLAYRLYERANPFLEATEGREEQAGERDQSCPYGALNADASQSHLQTASASASTGDKAV